MSIRNESHDAKYPEDVKGADSVATPDLKYDGKQRHTLTAKTWVSAVFTVIFAGIALCSDGYNAGIVGNMNLLFGEIYPKSIFNRTIKTRLSQAFFVGEIVGQLLFGAVIDRIGRKTGVVCTTLLLVLGIIISTAAHGAGNGIFWMMIIGRGIAGAGAGGEYPVCGVSAIEASDETAHVRKNRGFLIACVGDLAIDFGFVLSGIVPLIVLAAYGYSLNSPENQTNGFSGIWRICFGLGLVPPLAVFYFRIKMVNSTAFRNNAMKGSRINAKVMLLAIKRYWRRIIGTCLTWFLYDFCSYPFGLFSSTIISQVNPQNGLISNIAWGTLIVSFCCTAGASGSAVKNAFYLPGCLLGGILLDRIGRRNTQFFGFFSQGIVGMILGGALAKIQNSTAAFAVVYGIFLSLAEAGPGVATILISGEVYPTAIRGHLLGLSAAFGKAGAAIGTQGAYSNASRRHSEPLVFVSIENDFSDVFKGQQAVFLIGSAVSILGAIVTYFFIPDMSRQLEDEDVAWNRYLEANGVSTSQLGEPIEASASKGVLVAIEEAKD